MELSKKTTILFPCDLWEKLAALARQQGVSAGELVRRACEEYYRIASVGARVQAARDLAALSLPVSDPAEMAKESVPTPEELMP